MTFVAVSGPALPGDHHAAPVRADDDLGVDAAPVVLADGGDRFVVDGDPGAIDDPRMGTGVGGGTQCFGQHRHQVVDGAVDRRLAGMKQRSHCAGGQVGTQMNQHQQHLTGSGRLQGRPGRGGSPCWATAQTLWTWCRVRPLSGSRFRHRCGRALMSVVCDCMGFMAPTCTDTRAAPSGGDVVGGLRRRGKSKAPNFSYDGPVAVIRLELDASDDRMRRRLERQWEAVFRLRRALQRDAAARCRAYWAAHRERAADPKALRQRLGLTRKGIEAAAKGHIEASGWMRNHLTKAIGLHVADEVWETIDRHLFADSSGRRHGRPHIGAWWDFTRIPGRGRSHTKATQTWETYRLVGTLDGHLAAHRHPLLPAVVHTAHQAADQPSGTSILAPPARIPAPLRPASKSWWHHDGALAVVFTGLGAGDLVLPVRLAQGAGQWPHLTHFLADPTIWHKIDLARVADRKAPGGWRYYAHLLVHQAGYQSPSTIARREQIPVGRRAGVDANVSNVAVASFRDGQPAGCSSSRSSARLPNRRPPSGPPARLGHGRKRWIARGATPTPPSTAPRRDSRNAPSAAPRKDCPPARFPTRVGRGMPAAMEYRCARTATTNSRSDIGAPGAITPPKYGAPARPSKPAPTRSPPRSWPPTATRSRWRIAASPPGHGCGAKESRCSAPACSSLRCSRNATPPAAGFTGPALTPPRCLSTACAAQTCRKPLLSAPTSAHSAGCAASVTSCPPHWRPASSSPTPTTRVQRGSITDSPTLCAMG